MEYFDYADWLSEGRRSAKAKGNPDVDTERLYLEAQDGFIYIVYAVDLKTIGFATVVAEFEDTAFSNRFFNMLELEK